VLRNWSIVRTGTTAAQKSLFFNLRRLRAKIDDTGDAVMTAENRKWVSEHLGVPERDVAAMASRLSASDRSLNAPLSTDAEAQWQDLLPDDAATPDQHVEALRDTERRKAWITEALKTLNERETLIICERRLTDDTVTLEVLGKQLGISKERVRQIEHQALGKLRKALTSMVGDPEQAGLIPSL
jgi:RNA polymerase sigma-32 factor